MQPFHRVLAAEVVSNFGSMLSRLAIPWLATLALGATPLQMGVLLVADVAAGAAGALLLGALIDRLGKRAVMLGADLLRAAVLAGLAALASAQWLALWMLMLAAVASGLLSVAFELARSAWIAHRIAGDERPARNAQLAVGGSLSETAAFALGGWLYQGLGAVLALALDALSYLLSALCLRGAPEAPPQQVAAPDRTDATPRAALATLLSEASQGVTVVAASPVLRTLAGVEVLHALAMSLAGTSYMIFVTRDIAFGTGVLGLIFATGGLGSVAGGLVAPRMGRRLGSGAALALGLALAAVGAFCVPLAAGPTLPGAALLVAHQVIGDGGQTVQQVHDRTLRQTLAPPALLARVDAGIGTLGQLATLAGALGGGALATSLGVRPALLLAALCLAAAAVLAAARLMSRHALRDDDRSPR